MAYPSLINIEQMPVIEAYQMDIKYANLMPNSRIIYRIYHVITTIVTDS